jgi:hypothetical protein
MNRSHWIAFLLVFAPVVTSAVASASGETRVVDPEALVKTTLCELSAAPERFQGKVVEIRAIVQTGFQTSLLRDDSCSTFMWLAGIDITETQPDNQATSDNPALALRKDRQFQKMLEYLDKRYKPKGGSVCARCPLYKVTVTVIGRFDHVRQGDAEPKADLPVGFGYLHSYDSELTLLGVSNVVAEPIDRTASEKNK